MKLGIVLFNLGGPDKADSVRPFLRNLFSDRAIIDLPAIARYPLARFIADRRAPESRGIFAEIGGRSPIVAETDAQARALELRLAQAGHEVKAFVAMRYWHPFTQEAVAQLKNWNPDQIILLPLYPQYSTTTTGSSLTAWRQAAARIGLVADTTTLCCYPIDPAFTAATAALVKTGYNQARAQMDPAIPLRVLFSAHGLPEAIIKAGDPYQWQVEKTVAAVTTAWGESVDHTICYQSRATPQHRDKS